MFEKETAAGEGKSNTLKELSLLFL